MDNRGIGVFDSGLGGLTVVKALRKILPEEKIYYFGDTGRLPYGPKPKDMILAFSLEIAKFLMTKNIKILVIACNTATAHVLDDLKEHLDIPVVGVIDAGSRGAKMVTKDKKIGVIGTKGTIGSGIYERRIKEKIEGATVYSKACPLFAPLVEEGMEDDEVTYTMVEKYLGELKGRIDTLVLGCTHYPLLSREIKRYFEGNGVTLVDPAVETAIEVNDILFETDALGEGTDNHVEYYVSQSPEHFKKLGETFLGEKIENIQQINLEEY